MPTRSGLDFASINPNWFVCAYCYQATPNLPMFKFEGMITKRVRIRIDDEVDDFVAIPNEWTKIWTEPHCYPCNRRVKGYPVSCRYANTYKY